MKKVKGNEEFDHERKALRSLSTVPARDPETVSEAKKVYMTEVAKLQKPVSPYPKTRHTGWIANLLPRKEQYKMSTLASILVIMSLVVGGSGITVASAQNSLPDSILYPVKLLGEEVQMSLTGSPYAKWQLSLKLAEMRMEELKLMVSLGVKPSEPTLTRLNAQLEQTVRLAAGLPGDQATLALIRTQSRLETQERLMLQTRAANAECDAIKARIRQMIQERVRQIESGLQDPTKLQQQLQQQFQEQMQQQNQVQEQEQNQIETQAGDPNQYKTPQMPIQTRTPMPCPGNGQCQSGK